MSEELEITKENFDQYFYDVRKHKPQRGQIMAGYTAIADFVDGADKRLMIKMLKAENQAQPATRMMRKAFLATDREAIRVPLEIAKDLVAGMTEEEVAAKPYKYTMEMFFYTKEEYVPRDDPHWFVVSIVNLDKFLESENRVDQGQIHAKVVRPDPKA